VPLCPATSDKRADVIPACHRLTMDTLRRLRGIELRYVLTMHLFHHGHATITELVDALTAHGFDVEGRPSKSVSDALRWEMRRGRVRRFERGLYGPGSMPRGTEYRIHQRVLALRDEARKLSLVAGHIGVSQPRGTAEDIENVRPGCASPG
jgi:hypothetical protein